MIYGPTHPSRGACHATVIATPEMTNVVSQSRWLGKKPSRNRRFLFPDPRHRGAILSGWCLLRDTLGEIWRGR
jgi:hypothetical protein